MVQFCLFFQLIFRYIIFFYRVLFSSYSIASLIFLVTVSLSGYSQNYPPKREFRGVWVATVGNIDWPSSTSLTTEEQQREFIELVAFHKANGMNALIVQIRPSADALYQSNYEPWSQWLTGVEGRSPNPIYDPLEFMIGECRRQQMEFHAWINPFRAIFNYLKGDISEQHIFFDHPEWVVPYGKHSYLDPGLPEVRQHVLNVVMDVVNRYDIDGVHFDDYFYPYRIDSLSFLDETSFIRYGEQFDTIADWRRDNVNQFIQSVHDSIEAVKPEIRFGISPFGVWRNAEDDPLGSDSRAAQTSYDDLYADVITWLKNGWIDYVAPQLYFGIGFELADYQKLLDWWVKNTYGRQLYIGHATYKIGLPEDSLWSNPYQIIDQISLNRKSFQVDGSVFFSARSFKENPLGINDHLRSGSFKYPALIPTMPWHRSKRPNPPQNLVIARKRSEVLMQWQPDIHQDVCYYVVYGAEGDEPPNISDPTTIIAKSYYPQLTFKEGAREGIFRKKHTFVVTTVNRNHDESVISLPVQIRLFNN
ncbi:glycoside hydrolase family 10 protein [Tunicatimonas pelagia]|uniref:glycoside hydrolase family 10 protein n=1 Tax=Tunicatimonas pelagia TaxID=931531 RepID=UPI002666C22A|nr:family 10 glycosylhydrolase [Tunicatimonas pelagia]WKN43241.1 family 10 glycosylhydrolase [Tunicatimonas pelagia]